MIKEPNYLEMIQRDFDELQKAIDSGRLMYNVKAYNETQYTCPKLTKFLKELFK